MTKLTEKKKEELLNSLSKIKQSEVADFTKELGDFLTEIDIETEREKSVLEEELKEEWINKVSTDLKKIISTWRHDYAKMIDHIQEYLENGLNER